MSRLSIQRHQEWRVKLAQSQSFVDPVDAELDDMNVVDPYEIHAPSRRSDADLNRVLSILDNLESGKEITR